ncbi:CYSTM domain-containing protein [Caenorhabditis elegans]|uniref:CYSTM domain-containing protein n=1 Tax=Caenorhabditis elegans TaxID=6239 RepID=Q9U340_CAEEL|nr:CYSTM domain-containing protein [Caenorhabditis elegans]CAB63325.2 CYSTM domain-containing protein [Caenorhabditis elegans]|eukprot:NP_507212.2 Uncharacterized protein CELE_W06G6.9 [Caenorhabditis elegans]
MSKDPSGTSITSQPTFQADSDNITEISKNPEKEGTCFTKIWACCTTSVDTISEREQPTGSGQQNPANGGCCCDNDCCRCFNEVCRCVGSILFCFSLCAPP